MTKQLRWTIVTALLLATVSPAVAEVDTVAPSLRYLPTWQARPAPGDAPDLSYLQGDLDSSAPSAGKAVGLSLLLPGLGDYMLGHKNRATAFFVVEAAIWTTFIVSRAQGSQREDTYRDLAVRFAGVTRNDHSDDFYVEVRRYDSSDDYEDDIKAEGRLILTPDASHETLERYFAENRVADYEEWEWVSIERKVQFQDSRSSSKEAYRRADFAIAAAIANRLVSALFAYSAARAVNSEAVQARRYHVDFTPPVRYGRDYEAAVTLIRTF